MHPLLTLAIATLAALLAAALGLHLLKRLGPPGKALASWFTAAPGLDLWIFYFTIAPMLAGIIVGQDHYGSWYGWAAGLITAIAVQVLTVMIWTVAHELAHPKARKRKRLVHQINTSVGRLRNHTAVWWTALAVPLFAGVRVAEYIVYPPLTWIVRLPKYKTGDWVNVSRHKFEGLVGHDLIWCLYCDWMTGVWSLGTEMLRNVESFWCPIRFDSTKKCANCTIDFPDLDAGWAPAHGSIDDVRDVHAAHYPGPGNVNAWFGHPVRLTVKGKPADD